MAVPQPRPRSGPAGRPFTPAEQASITCKCGRTRCLKLYCDCFQSGSTCKPGRCECRNCGNTPAESGPGGARSAALASVLSRRPDAFQYRPKLPEGGCKCKKNRCLKKYCACFGKGRRCGPACICRNCENGTGLGGGEGGTTGEDAAGAAASVVPSSSSATSPVAAGAGPAGQRGLPQCRRGADPGMVPPRAFHPATEYGGLDQAAAGPAMSEV